MSDFHARGKLKKSQNSTGTIVEGRKERIEFLSFQAKSNQRFSLTTSSSYSLVRTYSLGNQSKPVICSERMSDKFRRTVLESIGNSFQRPQVPISTDQD
jgi:hypothetical protein